MAPMIVHTSTGSTSSILVNSNLGMVIVISRNATSNGIDGVGHNQLYVALVVL